MNSNLVGIIIYGILFISLVIAIVILITNKKGSNVKKDDYSIDDHNIVESISSSLERYTEIKIGDPMSKVIECLGSNYYSCTKWISATGTTTELIWQEWDMEKSRYQRVTVMFLNNKVIKLIVDNL